MPENPSPDGPLERCRHLACQAARLAHGGAPEEPGCFELATEDGAWLISSEEPWLQRLEIDRQPETGRTVVRAHVPVPGGAGAAVWDGAAARDFQGRLCAFVARHDLPMLQRFDLELTVAVSAVGDGADELRHRVDRATEVLGRQLAAVSGRVTVELFRGEGSLTVADGSAAARPAR